MVMVGLSSDFSSMRRASCVRDVTLSFRNTFLRWYSTVLVLRKSWAAISLFDAPSVARSATRASWGVSRGWWRGCGGGRAPRRREFGAGPLGVAIGTHAEEHLVGDPEVVAGVPTTLGSSQPLSEQQMGAGQVHERLGSCEVVNRLAVRVLGVDALADQPASTGG
jgi:hypothetical protein